MADKIAGRAAGTPASIKAAMKQNGARQLTLTPLVRVTLILPASALIPESVVVGASGHPRRANIAKRLSTLLIRFKEKGLVEEIEGRVEPRQG